MTINEWLGPDNKIGIDIWEHKYRYNNENFDEWLDRVSNNDEEVKALIKDKKFLFGGRILANRNTDGKKTYSNCYVLTPPEDNIESIFEGAKKLARTFSYGGGVGIDLKNLRPSNSKVNNAAKTTSGAVSFMEVYNMTTSVIGQNGRRGALMLSLPVNHPDVEEFVKVKSDLNKITNANISVRVDDKFMHAVENNDNYDLHFRVSSTGEEIVKTIKAKELFKLLCKMNWDYAEPGILFWDNITKHNLNEKDPNFEYAGTNPCAEEPLPAGGSCLLGSLNLSEFVKDAFLEDAYFDYNSFRKAVYIAVRALNDVLEEGLEKHPLEEQRESARKYRQIGLGIMGLADCLIRLKLRYGSEEANQFCEKLSKLLLNYALDESAVLGKEKGSFDTFNPDIFNESELVKSQVKKYTAMRNSQLLTIAPTGTLSTMLGISGGIEPIFAKSYTRTTKSLHGEDVKYKIYTPIVAEYMDIFDIKDEKDLPEYFITSEEINFLDRIKCQGAWQKYIDASISSTINLPNSATISDVENIYMEAWKHGLKGVTIYRAGCKREGILVVDNNEKDKDKVELKRGEIIDVPEGLTYKKFVINSGCGKLYLFIGIDKKGKIYDCFTNTDGVGGCTVNTQAVSRLISTSLRGGVDINKIIRQLQKAGTCPAYQFAKGSGKQLSPGKSCASAIANILSDLTAPKKAKKDTDNKCPECGETLRYDGGCIICPSCGWSKCE